MRIYDSKDGINNLGLYKILSLNDSTIIASSNNGLSVLNIKTGKAVNYFEGDGLQSNNFEETSGNEYKENLFFGGINGFTKIDKRKFVINNADPVLFFNSAQIQASGKIIDTSYLFIKKLKIPNNASLFTVNFSSLYYSSPEKIQFEYRINQKSDTWVSIGSSHSISIIPLPPGTYRLQLRAANEAGVWSKPDRTHPRLPSQMVPDLVVQNINCFKYYCHCVFTISYAHQPIEKRRENSQSISQRPA